MRGKVTRGDAPPPPPFVPRVGGGAMLARGPFVRCTRPRDHPPPTGARGRRGQSPALTHPRAESGQGTDSGGAHARRRGASAKCRGECREAPTRRGQAGRLRRQAWGGVAGGWERTGTSALPRPPVGAFLQEPPAPGEARRLRPRRELHLRGGPLPHYPRPSRSPGRERQETPNSWRAGGSGVPGVGGDALSRAREREGDNQES